MKRIIGAVLFVLLLGACRSTNQPKEPDNQVVDTPIDAAHNSRNSLTWAGSYQGEIPGADVPGIKVDIILYEDESYNITYVYLGKDSEPFVFTGTFKWDDEGNTIILDSTVFPPYYRVGENTLTQLDMDGNIITGQLADLYVLKKAFDN